MILDSMWLNKSLEELVTPILLGIYNVFDSPAFRDEELMEFIYSGNIISMCVFVCGFCFIFVAMHVFLNQILKLCFCVCVWLDCGGKKLSLVGLILDGLG